MSAPPRFLLSVHNEYPDDNSDKVVMLHANGFTVSSERHVILQWLNGMQGNTPITQVVQLTGQPGNYNYFTPVVKWRSRDTDDVNQVLTVGTFSRTQRDQILRLASRVKFRKPRPSTTAGFGCETCW